MPSKAHLTMLLALGVGACQQDPQALCFLDSDCNACETCQNGECRPKPGCVDPCAEQICETPWVPICLDAKTSRSYSLPGQCRDGACQYAYQDVACEASCDASLGWCAGGCPAGERVCTADLQGFSVCGPDPGDPQKNSFGPKVACTAGVPCLLGECQNQVCVESRVMLLLDRSTRMLLGDAFSRLVPTLLAKLQERGMANWFGFRQFPEGGECRVAAPLVPMKNAAATIQNLVLSPTNLTTAPIGAALRDLETALGDPGDGQAAVLITSQVETCESSAETVQHAAALYRRGIRLFVVSINPAADRGFLDQLAKASGTGSSVLAQTPVELADALDGVFQALAACACVAGQTRCFDDHQFGCGASGFRFEPQQACPLGCNGDACLTCAEGQTRCAGDSLERCRTDRLDFEFDHLCEPFGCSVELERCFRDGDLKWKLDRPSNYSFDLCPAIGQDGTLYMVISDHEVSPRSSVVEIWPDGRLGWEYPVGNDISRSVALDSQDNVYFGSDDFKVYSLTKDGRFRWSYPTGGEIWCTPAIGVDDRIYVGSTDGNLYAFDPDGNRRWFYPNGTSIYDVVIRPDGVLYGVGYYVVALTPEGKLLWRYTLGGSYSSPAVGADGSLYVFNSGGDLVAITPDGQPAWTHDTSSDDTYTAAPAVGADGTIFAPSHSDSVLYALWPNGGKRWQLPLAYTVHAGLAVDSGGFVYAPVNWGCILYAVDPGGAVAWTFTGDDYCFSMEPPTLAPDGTLYLATLDLFALYNDSPLASGAWPKIFGDLKNSGRRH